MLQHNLVKVAMQKRDGFPGAPSPFLFSRPFELRSPTWSSTQKIGSRMAPKCLEELRNIPPLPAELTALALKLPNWRTRFTRIFKIRCSFLSLMRKCKGVGNRLRLNLCLRDAHLGMDLAEYIATGLNLQHCLMSSSWCWSWCLKAQSHLEANTHSSSTRFINIAQNKNALEIIYIYIYINFFIYGTSLHSTPPAPRFQMQSPPASAHPKKTATFWSRWKNFRTLTPRSRWFCDSKVDRVFPKTLRQTSGLSNIDRKHILNLRWMISDSFDSNDFNVETLLSDLKRNQTSQMCPQFTTKVLKSLVFFLFFASPWSLYHSSPGH